MLKRLFNFCNNLGSRIKQWVKPTTAMLVTASLTDMTRSKADLIAENAMLRQQLIVLNLQVKRPQLTNRDRLRLVREYVEYYNQARPHQGINQQIPDWYDQDYPLATGPIIATPVLNGLHHDYSRAAYLH